MFDLSAKESKLRYNLTFGQEQSRRQLVKSGLDLCINVLAYCAQQDSRATHYLKVIRTFKGMILAQGVPSLEHQKDSTPVTSLNQPTSRAEARAYAETRAVPSFDTNSYESLSNLSAGPSNISSTPSLHATSGIWDTGFEGVMNSSSQSSSTSSGFPSSEWSTYGTDLYNQWAPYSTSDPFENGMVERHRNFTLVRMVCLRLRSFMLKKMPLRRALLNHFITFFSFSAGRGVRDGKNHLPNTATILRILFFPLVWRSEFYFSVAGVAFWRTE